MYIVADYARQLRAIGQALETLNVRTFEIEPDGEAYFVRGTVAVADPDAAQGRLNLDKVRAIWAVVPGQNLPFSPSRWEKETATTEIDLHYSPKDVERLELEGRAKRVAADRKADPSSLSQLLRCVGAYLTQRVARLRRISREGDSLSIEYETSLGSQVRETLAAADLYNLWVRMYVQRSSRAVH